MTTQKKNPERALGVSDTRLQVNATACYGDFIKAVAPAMTNQLYTISIKRRKPIAFISALVSPMRCEYVSFPWKRPIKNAKNAPPVTLLIFKSGLNRIILTVGSSPLTDEVGAATPEKMFLMLVVLPEIETSLQVKSSS